MQNDPSNFTGKGEQVSDATLGPSQGAGVALAFVPITELWVPVSVIFKITTENTPGTRKMIVSFGDDSGNVIGGSLMTHAQSPNSTVIYTFALGLNSIYQVFTSNGSDDSNQSPMSEIRLPPLGIWAVVLDGVKGGDIWENVVFTYRRFRV